MIPVGTVRVYEVLADGREDGPSGPAGDGTFVHRFRGKADAERFARGNTCYGKPATVIADDVPRSLARRWGLA